MHLYASGDAYKKGLEKARKPLYIKEKIEFLSLVCIVCINIRGFLPFSRIPYKGMMHTMHTRAEAAPERWNQAETEGKDVCIPGCIRMHTGRPECIQARCPDRTGAFLPNGQSAKRGLNHALRSAGLAGIVEKLEYKTRLTGRNRLIFVNPAYTSQTCSKCGHCAKENRESQADFECRQCHARMNADLNAARNILKRGLNHLIGLDEAEHARTKSDVPTAYSSRDASAMTCETSTR